MTTVDATGQFRAARDFLLRHREDYTAAYEGFVWPRPDHFNWALDWFDVIAAGNDRPALRIVEEDGSEAVTSFREMATRSDQVANWLRGQGVAAGDRVLVMLGNQTELWETALAAMKLRAVVIPATPLLAAPDLRDRIARGRVRHVIARADDVGKFTEVPGEYTRIVVGSDGTHVDAGGGRLTRRGPPAARTTGPTRAPTAGGLTRRPTGSPSTSHPTGSPAPTTPCCSTSPPAPPPAPNWSSTPMSRTPSATSRRCTGSVSGPAMCTSTSPRPAGPSTPGRTSSPRGTRRRPSSSTTTPASTPSASWPRWTAPR